MLWGCAVLAMVSVIGAGLWSRRSVGDELDNDAPAVALAQQPLASVPNFSLLDQDGKSVTLESLRGKPWVADFIFTHCAGPCPTMTTKMAVLVKSMPSSDVQWVSISVDPERDTPEVLKKYATQFGADESRWKFLTGDVKEIHDLSRSMLLAVAPATDGSPIIHSNQFVLVDADGKIRRYYSYDDAQELAELQADAEQLAEEAKR